MLQHVCEQVLSVSTKDGTHPSGHDCSFTFVLIPCGMSIFLSGYTYGLKYGWLEVNISTSNMTFDILKLQMADVGHLKEFDNFQNLDFLYECRQWILRNKDTYENTSAVVSWLWMLFAFWDPSLLLTRFNWDWGMFRNAQQLLMWAAITNNWYYLQRKFK